MMHKFTNNNDIVLITGSAGFIGYHLSISLLQLGIKVIGFDNLNEYYDINLKINRLKNLNEYNNFVFIKGDLSNKDDVIATFNEFNPSIVINLGAQAGVRYSIDNPEVYIESNIVGFFNI